jgi:RNA polymerase sigma-70 factor (ECF subfamily)
MDFSSSDRQEAQRSLGDNVTLPAGNDPLDERNRALRVVISAAARGDIKAFESLYHSTAGWLLSRVRRITGDAHAEDVLAQVYLQVWLSLPSVDASRGQPLAWLATIGRSRALDKLRTERRAHGGQLEAPSAEAAEESDDRGPEELLAMAQRSNLLMLSMGALSCKEQLVLSMAYFRDCSQSEISVLTGMPLGTVKTLITRSQQKLRVAMAAGSKGDAVHNASFESLASP